MSTGHFSWKICQVHVSLPAYSRRLHIGTLFGIRYRFSSRQLFRAAGFATRIGETSPFGRREREKKKRYRAGWIIGNFIRVLRRLFSFTGQLDFGGTTRTTAFTFREILPGQYLIYARRASKTVREMDRLKIRCSLLVIPPAVSWRGRLDFKDGGRKLAHTDLPNVLKNWQYLNCYNFVARSRFKTWSFYPSNPEFIILHRIIFIS